jgi:hypothetical protein
MADEPIWRWRCPKCAAPLNVVAYAAETEIALCRDGFDTAEAKFLNTTTELVECSLVKSGKCDYRDDLELLESDHPDYEINNRDED